MTHEKIYSPQQLLPFCPVIYREREAGVAPNLYIREYVPMGIDSLQNCSKSIPNHSESIPMGTF